MAKRRMISMDVFGRGAFLELPPECIALYSILTLYADDDGFHGAPKQAARMLGYDLSALKTLEEAGFIICFESGVAAITHWKLTNCIPKDRYTPTVYQKELSQLNYAPGEGYILKPEAAPAPEAPAESNTPDGTGLPLADGSEYYPTPEEMEEYRNTYPEADLTRELRAMRGWLLSHPEKRRSKENIGAFMHYWLNNAVKNAKQPQQKGPSFLYNPPEIDGKPHLDIARAEYLANTTVPKFKKKNQQQGEDRESF